MAEDLKETTNGVGGGYSEGSIRVLEGLEAVRMRPAMYIGDIGERGLHHLINEVVDNAIDEALAGYCRNIVITLHDDGSCSCDDDGRGIPTGKHPVKGISTLEVVMCTLHAGGKFDHNTYKVSGGLHGVGVSCVNALSNEMEVTVWREGKEYVQKYSKGVPLFDVKEVGASDRTGTRVRFLPDDTIFKTTKFKFNKTAERLRELAFLNPYVTITFIDEREDIKEVFHYSGGLVDFVKYIDDGLTPINKPILLSGSGKADDGSDVQVEICFEYNTAYTENLLSYVNNINTIEGGTHVTGFRSALTRTINLYYSNQNSSSKNKVQIIGEDFRPGLTAIISIKVSSPQFEGQTKTKLGNGDVEGIVRGIVNEKLTQHLDQFPNDAKRIIEKVVSEAEGRIRARQARDMIRRKNALENSTLPGKLADCSINNPEACELYIVEGDSAGGSAKQGRDRRFQAILPLRGKILNVLKAKPLAVFENEEVRTMITAIGAGFEEEFDVNKTRYGKIILMADADVDGSHIRTLLMTFFFCKMQDLILGGKLFIAQPPLYKLKKGKQEYYAFNEAERDEIIERIRKESPKAKVATAESFENEESNEAEIEKINKDGIVISRFKGLGEMNPEQLWDTTMNPDTRTLLQVTIGEAAEAAKIFQTLMGDNVEPRRSFIEKNAQYVKDLDV
ncbi:MAG: DNA topoisomerase (ATP-hydrolyzing) subunit B [Chloroflexota bacterium]